MLDYNEGFVHLIWEFGILQFRVKFMIREGVSASNPRKKKKFSAKLQTNLKFAEFKGSNFAF